MNERQTRLFQCEPPHREGRHSLLLALRRIARCGDVQSVVKIPFERRREVRPDIEYFRETRLLVTREGRDRSEGYIGREHQFLRVPLLETDRGDAESPVAAYRQSHVTLARDF